jgi:hypothetical protein
MADERDQWLDEETAERLLRGEPVERFGDGAHRAASHLSDALRSLAPVTSANSAGAPGGTGAETCGEAAAVAAFRQARVAARAPRHARSRQAAGSGRGARDGSLGAVRIGPARRAPEGSSSRRRRGRAGLAAVVAGCTIGSVALALSTSMAASPMAAGSVIAHVLGVTSTQAHSLRHATPSGATMPSGTGASRGAVPASPAPAPPAAVRGLWAVPEAGVNGVPALGDVAQGAVFGPPLSMPSWYPAVVDACRAYRGGRTDSRHTAKVLQLPQGAAGVRQYCDDVLGDSTAPPAHGPVQPGGAPSSGLNKVNGGTVGSGSSGEPHMSSPPALDSKPPSLSPPYASPPSAPVPSDPSAPSATARPSGGSGASGTGGPSPASQDSGAQAPGASGASSGVTDPPVASISPTSQS